jgi:large subunit ribosomal protein L25
MNGKNLTAEPRELKGKNNNNRLRVDGYIPAVIYSHGESEAIKIKEKDFFNLFKGNISESIIFNIDIAGKNNDDMAFIKDYQEDPVTGDIIHLDLFKVTRGEKIKTNIPVELIGTPVGIKMGGVFKHGEREIHVQCLPKYLPEKIEVDVTDLKPGDAIVVSDLKISDDVEILTTPENIIAAVYRPRAIASEEPEEAAEETTEEAGEEN